LKELAAACARQKMRLGFYYSQAQDWHEPDGAGNTWDFGPDEKKDYDKYLRGKAEPQVRELLTNYAPVCLIWFDTPRMMTPERSVENLSEVGKWLRVNGEAVYGTGRSPFGEEFGGYLADVKDRNGQRVWGSRSDWRCTTRPGKLYLTVFAWPRGGFDLPRFKNKIKTTYLLADPEKKPLPMKTGA